MDSSCNIASLTDPDFGEQTAQACVIACSRQLGHLCLRQVQRCQRVSSELANRYPFRTALEGTFTPEMRRHPFNRLD